MSGFDQWSGAAGSAADKYGIDRSVFFGLIDTESSWNPNASPGTTSAYGFTQLVKGTAAQMGVDRFNPIQNLDGGAHYLSSLLKQSGGDYKTALSHYYEGPKGSGQHGGLAYANKVLGKAQSYLDKGKGLVQQGQSLLGIDAGTALNMVIPGAGVVTDALGLSGDSCGWLCQFQKWVKDSGFFQRLALAVLALVIIAAGFALFRGQSMAQAFSPKKG